MYVGVNRIHPEGTPRRARTERWCQTCKGWYPAKRALCPDCRAEKPQFNAGLRIAMLNENRTKMVEAKRKAGEL